MTQDDGPGRVSSSSASDSNIDSPDRDERATRVAPAHRSKPWWQEAALFSAIAALLGTLALTANGYIQAQFDHDNNLHEIRTVYLDRALDPARTRDYRLSVLRFLTRTFAANDPMGDWAKEELEQLAALPEVTLKDLAEQDLAACEEVLRQNGVDEAPTDPSGDGENDRDDYSRPMADGDINTEGTPTEDDPSAGDPDRSAGTERVTEERRRIKSVVHGCCITCHGMEICGFSVSTPCGTCSAGG